MNFIFLKCDLCVLPQFPLIYKFSIKFNTLLNFLSEFPLEMRETQSVKEIQNQTDGVVECVLLRLGSTLMRRFYLPPFTFNHRQPFHFHSQFPPTRSANT